jgi:hypothetical protein
VIETATNKLKTWIPLSASGYGTATARDGRWILVAMQSTSQVAVLDLETLQVAPGSIYPQRRTKSSSRPTTI